MALSEAEELEYLQLKKRKAQGATAPEPPAPGSLRDIRSEMGAVPAALLGVIERTGSSFLGLRRPPAEGIAEKTGELIGEHGIQTALPAAVQVALGGITPQAIAGAGAAGAAAEVIQGGARNLAKKAGMDVVSAPSGGEIAGDAAQAAVINAATAGIPLLKGPAKALGKKAISATLGPSSEAVAARFTRNAAIKNAKPFDVLARELPDDVAKLSEKVGEMSDKALATLSSSKYLMEGAQAKDALLGAVAQQKRELGRGVSNSTVTAKKILTTYEARLKRLGNTVSEREIGKIIRDIDNDIDWAVKEKGPINNALEGIRTKIDDILKSENKDYATAMEPVAEGVRLLKKSQSLFGIEREIGKGYKATNRTAAALKGAINETRVDSQDVLEALKKTTGRDYLAAAEDAALAGEFVSGKTQGSRRVNLGAIIGGAAGYPMAGAHGGLTGTLVGGLAGAHLDREGGKIAGTLIDKLVGLSQRRLMPAPSPGLQAAISAAAASAMRPRRAL